MNFGSFFSTEYVCDLSRVFALIRRWQGWAKSYWNFLLTENSRILCSAEELCTQHEDQGRNRVAYSGWGGYWNFTNSTRNFLHKVTTLLQQCLPRWIKAIVLYDKSDRVSNWNRQWLHLPEGIKSKLQPSHCGPFTAERPSPNSAFLCNRSFCPLSAPPMRIDYLQ